MPIYCYIASENELIMEWRKEIDKKLLSATELSAADFFLAYPDLPRATVYSRIRALVQSGKLVAFGKGRYRPIVKQSYKVEVTNWMRDVNSFLIDACEGINHCVSQYNGQLIVQVPRNDMPIVLKALNSKYDKVIPKKVDGMIAIDFDGYIIVDALVSDAPLLTQEGVKVSSLEKTMVDMICSNRGSLGNLRVPFQRLMDVYPVNYNRLNRYASRRGVSKELSDCLSFINMTRVDSFTHLQKYFSGTYITKAWVFGSFARCEESPSSDLDLLVEYDHNSPLSLIGFNGYKLDIEKIMNRSVDLVVDGTLLPFARPSAERDKYLLYER